MRGDPGLDGAALQRLFLAPPLHSNRYALGFGTVYTAAYRPAAGRMLLAWPGLPPWPQSFAAFTEEARGIIYPDGESPRARPPSAPGEAATPPRDTLGLCPAE